MTARRSLLAILLALALVAAACGGDDSDTAAEPSDAGTAPEGATEPTGSSGELTTLRVATIPIADLGAYFYAIDEGIFEEHGLNVENVDAAGGAAGIAAMTGGEVDLTYTNNVSVILSASEGLPITIVSGANRNVAEGDSDMAAFVVSSDVQEPADLVGKTVASNALNNINWLFMRVFLRENGVDPDEVEYVEVPFPEQPAALLEGRIQGTLIPEPFKTQLLQEEGPSNLGNAYRAGEEDDVTPIASFASTPDFAEENADVLNSFREALAQAIEESEQDPDGLYAAVANHTALEGDIIEQITLATFTTEVSPELLDDLAGKMVEEGLLGEDEVPEVESLISFGS